MKEFQMTHDEWPEPRSTDSMYNHDTQSYQEVDMSTFGPDDFIPFIPRIANGAARELYRVHLLKGSTPIDAYIDTMIAVVTH
jgi:hypothetical protein